MKRVPSVWMSPLRLLREGASNPIAIRTEIFQKYGDIARLKLGKHEIIYIFNPDFIAEVLGEKEDRYLLRSPLMTEGLEPIAGRDISVFVNNDLRRWRRDRKIAKMSFDEKGHYRAYARTIATRTTEHVERWRTMYRDGDRVDIESQINLMVVDMVIHTLFTDLGVSTQELAELIVTAADVVTERARALNPLPWYLPTKTKNRFDGTVERGQGLTKGIVKRRIEQGRDYDDLLSNFIASTELKNKEEIIEDVAFQFNGLIGVGSMTTSTLVHWSLVVLSQFPEIERRIESEVTEQIGDRLPRFEDLANMPFLHAFLKEVLRLYPSGLSINRQAIEGGEVMGYWIPKGASVIGSIYHVHRHPEFWSNPAGFDPQRFLDRPLGQEHPYGYMPFGGGQRACIGRSFALMEATIMLVTIVRRARLCLPPHAEVRYKFPTALTMRPSVQTMRLRFKGS